MDASTLLKPYRLKPFCQWIILRGRPLNYLPWNFIHKTQGRKLPNPKENIKKNQVRSVRREQDRFIVTRAGIIYWSIDFSRWFTSINRIKSRVNPGSCQLFWDSPRLIGLLIGLDQKERIFLPKKTNKQNKTKTKQTKKNAVEHKTKQMKCWVFPRVRKRFNDSRIQWMESGEDWRGLRDLARFWNTNGHMPRTEAQINMAIAGRVSHYIRGRSLPGGFEEVRLVPIFCFIRSAGSGWFSDDFRMRTGMSERRVVCFGAQVAWFALIGASSSTMSRKMALIETSAW